MSAEKDILEELQGIKSKIDEFENRCDHMDTKINLIHQNVNAISTVQQSESSILHKSANSITLAIRMIADMMKLPIEQVQKYLSESGGHETLMNIDVESYPVSYENSSFLHLLLLTRDFKNTIESYQRNFLDNGNNNISDDSSLNLPSATISSPILHNAASSSQNEEPTTSQNLTLGTSSMLNVNTIVQNETVHGCTTLEDEALRRKYKNKYRYLNTNIPGSIKQQSSMEVQEKNNEHTINDVPSQSVTKPSDSTKSGLTYKLRSGRFYN